MNKRIFTEKEFTITSVDLLIEHHNNIIKSLKKARKELQKGGIDNEDN